LPTTPANSAAGRNHFEKHFACRLPNGKKAINLRGRRIYGQKKQLKKAFIKASVRRFRFIKTEPRLSNIKRLQRGVSAPYWPWPQTAEYQETVENQLGNTF
jgi:hypothetical protein